MAAIGLGIIAVWWLIHAIGLDHGSTNPVGLYAECSTMGTIVILFVYFLTTLSLPVFMWRRHRAAFSPFRHIAIPLLGALTLIVPFVELCKPGSPRPTASSCFGCDNCDGVCPDNAVLKVPEADGYAFDLGYCKGCGICVEECPCGAIEMIGVPICGCRRPAAPVVPVTPSRL